MTAKKIFSYLLIAFVIFVFIQSLAYKFTGSEQTVIIFTTIATWMSSVGLGAIAPTFSAYGGYIVGGTELLASLMLLTQKWRRAGALLGLLVISGAIFFHLFTPLGVDRKINAAGDTDGGALFFMACGVWLSCALLIWMTKAQTRRTNDYRS